MGFSKLGLMFILLLLQCDLLIPARSMVAGRLATRGAGGGGGRRGSGFVGGGSGGGGGGRGVGGGGGGGRSGSTGKGWGNNGGRNNPPLIPGGSTSSRPHHYAMFPVLTGGHTGNYRHNQGVSSGHTLNCTRPLSYLALTMLIYVLLSQV